MNRALALALAFISLSSSWATSTGRLGHRQSSACSISAKFIEARINSGKVDWIFSPMDRARSPNCDGIGETLSVLIPSGSFSKLSQSIVYPLSITEPLPGSEVLLRIEKIAFSTGKRAWLLSDGPDALTVKH